MSNEQTTQQRNKNNNDAAADLVAIAGRLDQLVDVVTIQQQQIQQIARAPSAPNKRQPLKASLDDLVQGKVAGGEQVLDEAQRRFFARVAFDEGIATEPDAEGLSPWAVAGIALGAGLVGAGIAVGVTYALNQSEEG